MPLLNLLVAILISLFCSPIVFAQTPSPTENDAVRVTVTMNADGSRTVSQYDNEHRTATATTTDPDGTLRATIRYELDDSGRFKSGLIFGPDQKLRFKALYKYGSSGRLEEETHLGKDDAVINKIVYKYDPAGKMIGYSVFDASGKLVSGINTPTPTPLPRRRNALGR